MRISAFFIILSISLSCTKVIEIPGSKFKAKPVLIGIIHPDSSLSVRLFISRAADDTSRYKPIVSSKVAFYENNNLIGNATYAGDGYYVLSVKPKEGYTYKVQAETSEYGTLEAEDFLPPFPSYTVTVGDRSSLNSNSNPDITLKFIKSDNTYYWIGINYTQLSYMTPQACRNVINSGGTLDAECKKYLIRKSNYVTSRSSVFDMFNGSFDEINNDYMFSSIARLLPEFVTDNKRPQVVFSMRNQGGSWSRVIDGEENILEFTATGPAFDKYLKTSLFSLENQLVDSEGVIRNPFAEPTSAFSNVKNGLGIFGARNGKYIMLKLNSTSSNH